MVAKKTGYDTEATVVSKGPCDCGSEKGAVLYSDGHTHCFSCKKTTGPNGGSSAAAPVAPKQDADVEALLAGSQVKSLRLRGITQATATHFDYRVKLSPKGHVLHLAPYRDDHGQIIFVKVRDTGTQGTDKAFRMEGQVPKEGAPGFGQNLGPSSGKMITIVGGEIDAMSVSQVFDNKYRVVSPPKGEGSLEKYVLDNMEMLLRYERIVLGMDNDPAGKVAQENAAKVLPPGRCFLAEWSMKDPNEMLLAGRAKEISQAVWNAAPYRPDGIVDARDLTERCVQPTLTGIPWPWQFLTDWTYGRRYGETYLLGGGSGLGKSDLEAEVIAADLMGVTKDGLAFAPQSWGLFAYEAGAATTKKTIAGKIAKRRFHIPDADWTQDELVETMRRMDTDLWEAGGKLYINDSMGMADWDAVKERMRFLRHAYNVRHFLVDPVGALVTDSDDERKDLDRIALEFAKMMVELNACGYIVSHLTRPSMGPSHEEGGKVSLKQFRGSNGLIMFSNFVIGLERDQQADDERDRTRTTLRSLKDRFTGNSVGKTHDLFYDVLNGTLDTVNLGENL